jgi:hypothetical protein
VRWLLPLTADPAIQWSGLRKPVQKRIKKSQRAGVQIRITQNREDVAQHYRLHLLTRSKKHGMPAQLRRFFTTTTTHTWRVLHLLPRQVGSSACSLLVGSAFHSGLQVRLAALFINI